MGRSPQDTARRSATARWVTFGCRVNQYDTQAGRERFAAHGVDEAPVESAAGTDPALVTREPDLLVVNTCSVTARAAARSRQAIRSLRRQHPRGLIVATGCHARVAAEELERMPEVDVVIPDITRDSLAGLLPPLPPGVVETPVPITSFGSRTRAYLKVQEGCEAACTYCIVPRARGPMRSRTVAQVVREVRELVSRGYREVVLAGIHVGGYGRDLAPPATLAHLLQAVHEGCPELPRLRLSSLEPFEVSAELLAVLPELDRFTPHLHLPLQHADDRVLRRMNRRYTLERFRELVAALRDALPDPGLTTDVITGFPGETPEAHDALLEALQELSFDRVHLFPFSPRPGTPAARLTSELAPAQVREGRRQELLGHIARVTLEAHRRRLGQLDAVLLEHPAARGAGLEGYTSRYHRVVVTAPGARCGDLLPVRLAALQPPAGPAAVPILRGEPLAPSPGAREDRP